MPPAKSSARVLDDRPRDDRTPDPRIAEAMTRLPRVVDLLAARAEEHDRDATFPYQGVEVVHEAGLLTLTVGERYGGPGATLPDVVRVLGELGRGDASVALLVAHTLLLHAEQVRVGRWPAAGYRRLLTESRRGPALINTLDAEPGSGTPDGLPGTVAHRDGDAWVLNGRKTHCTGAEALAWMAVRARTDEPVPRVRTFLVRGDSPGVEVDPTWDQLGLRAGVSHDVVLTDVRVPADAALGLRPGSAGDTAAGDTDGVEGAADGVADGAAELTAAWRDLALAAVQLGVARAARQWLVGYLGRCGEQPAYVALGELEVTLLGAEELVGGLAERIERAEPGACGRTAAARLLVGRAATSAVQQAVALSGEAGLSRRHPMERYLRDVLSGRVFCPAERSVLDAAGRTALGRP